MPVKAIVAIPPRGSIKEAIEVAMALSFLENHTVATLLMQLKMNGLAAATINEPVKMGQNAPF